MRNSPADVTARAARPPDGAAAVERSDAPRTVAVAERGAPAATASRFGPLGRFAKRLVQRLIRFYTVRQDAMNAQLAARMNAIETMLGEVPELRRDITGVALDFGAMADRMRVLENVRRIVERSAAYRNEVRAHRRELLDLRQHLGTLSTRMTLVQRETAGASAFTRQIRDDMARLAESADVLAASVDVLANEQLVLGDAAAARDERLAELAQSVADVQVAAARDLEQLAAALRETIGLAREATDDAQQREDALRSELGEQIEAARGSMWKLQTTIEALARDVSGVIAAGDRFAGAEQRLDRVEALGDRIIALERRDEDLSARDAALERGVSSVGDRVTGAERRIDRVETIGDRLVELERRDADLAGALNHVEDRATANEAAVSRLGSLADAIRAETQAVIAAERERRLDGSAGADRALAAEIETLRQGTATLAAHLDELRERLFATPYVSAPVSAWPIRRISTPDDFDYVGFEDVFRGPEEFIRERLQRYVPLVKEHAPIVEIGAGRGEFMEVMREHGIAASGVDLNAGAVERCRQKGLDNVALGDANAYLASLEEHSAGAVFSAQFAEHVSFEYLLRFLELARTRLVPGGLFIAETVNPNSIEGWKTFFVDLTHVKPLFPEVFVFLCRSMGFADARIYYPNGGGFEESRPGSQPEYAVVATAPSAASGPTLPAAGSDATVPPRQPRARRRR
jgi:SAM-dependent methyltransferase